MSGPLAFWARRKEFDGNAGGVNSRAGIGTYRDSDPFLRSIARPFSVLCLLWAVLAASQKAGARPRPWADNKSVPGGAME